MQSTDSPAQRQEPLLIGLSLLRREVHAMTLELTREAVQGPGGTGSGHATVLEQILMSRLPFADLHGKVVLFASATEMRVPLARECIDQCEVASRGSAALRALFWAAYRRSLRRMRPLEPSQRHTVQGAAADQPAFFFSGSANDGPTTPGGMR